MPAANGLFADGGWLNSPQDIEFASKGAFRFREFKTELRDILSCFLQTDYKGEFANSVIQSRTLVDTGVTPGVYNNVTVNSKGQVTSAELKNPLGDPIHSPGGSGDVDCGDIPAPAGGYDGFTRVGIDEFGRVITGDCVSPTIRSTVGTPEQVTQDGVIFDAYGRITGTTFANYDGRINTNASDIDALETDLGDLEASLGGGGTYFDIGGKRIHWVRSSAITTEGSFSVNYGVSFASVSFVSVSTVGSNLSTENVWMQLISSGGSSATCYAQSEGITNFSSHYADLLVIGNAPA